MSYFSRLTEIITCNLSELLETVSDPKSELPKIIAEIKEGLQGAERSVGAASESACRIEKELNDHQRQIAELCQQARGELAAGREQDARGLLVWNRAIQDVVAGLRQQHQAAMNTRDHLTTTLRAVESRLAEACRKQCELQTGRIGAPLADTASAREGERPLTSVAAARAREVDSELEAMKRELQQ